jgi:CheY-like chemotaxis protein
MDYRKVLIVDDEPDICELLKEEFEDFGLSVDIAYNGQDALECLKKCNAFLVFSDINMPVMNGVELLAHIQQIEDDRPYVILCTGFKGYEREQLINKGAMDLINKPFDFELLEQMVEQLKGSA